MTNWKRALEIRALQAVFTQLVLHRLRPPAKRWSARSLAVGAGAGVAGGATLMYFLDPDRGRKRRKQLRDRTGSTARRSGKRVKRTARVGARQVQGRTLGLIHRCRPAEPAEPLDDVTLAHKVESVLYRDREVPKGRISINAEEGVVFLRGEVDRPELVHELEDAVRRIAGVRAVENLLHLPGTPAPASQGGHLLR